MHSQIISVPRGSEKFLAYLALCKSITIKPILSDWLYNLHKIQTIKGLLKVSSPKPSKQGQLWSQLRMLKVLSNWILKTCKDGGCTMSLSYLFHCWLSLPINVFLHAKPKPPSLPCVIARGPWLHFLDNLLVCIRRLLLDHTNIFSQLKHCPAAGLLCSQDTELPSIPPGEWPCQDHPSVVWDMVYFQLEHLYSVNSVTAGMWNTGEGHLPSVVSWNLRPFKDCIWSLKLFTGIRMHNTPYILSILWN